MSYVVKTKCRNVVLLGDMNISRLMTNAQQVESDKLREQAKENNKDRTKNYEYFLAEIRWWKFLAESAKVCTPSPFINLCLILQE